LSSLPVVGELPRVARGYCALVLARPKLALALLALLALLAAFYAPQAKVDASADSLVLEGDRDLEFFRQLGEQYAAEDYLLIAYRPKQALLGDASLRALAQLVDQLQALDGVSSVVSILDVPLLYSPPIAISQLAGGVKTLRDEAVDRELVSQELQNSPIYRQLLTSADGKTTAIQVNLQRDARHLELLALRDSWRQQVTERRLTADEKAQSASAEQQFKAYVTQSAVRQQALVAEVRALLHRHQPHIERAFLAGVPMIASDMVDFVKSDLQWFGSGIVLFIILLLAVIFRSWRWVLLPLSACLLSNLYMLGLLGWLDWRMTVISANFVALLLIITLAIAVHLVVRYRELQAVQLNTPRYDVVLATVSSMLRPCLYTAMTTIVAFMSLLVSGIRPVIDFGWMMTAGVVVALATTFIVVPAGMMLGSMPRPREEGQSRPVLTLRFASLTERRGTVILCVAAIIGLFSLSGIRQLQVENRFIDYFDQSTEIYRGMELVDSELGGTIPLDIILFSDPSNEGLDEAFDDSFYDSFDDAFEDDFAVSPNAEKPLDSRWFTLAGLNEIARIHRHLDQLEETGKVLSLATLYRVAEDLLGGGIDDIQLALAYQKLPPDIKQVMISPYFHAPSDQARITVRVKETSRSLQRGQLLADLDHFMRETMGYAADRYRFSGMLVLYNNMLQSLFTSQILTLGMVFVAITVMLALLFRSLSLALIGILPNMMAALLVLGGMGWFSVPLDMMTITIAAISIGIGVDNTIHYVHRFQREFLLDRCYTATMYRCHGSIGRAMYYTSITVIFGFSLLSLSNFRPSIYFGLLTGVAMASALLGSLLLLPKLLLWCKPLGAENRGALH